MRNKKDTNKADFSSFSEVYKAIEDLAPEKAPYPERGKIYREQVKLLNLAIANCNGKAPQEALDKRYELTREIKADMYVDFIIGAYWDSLGKDELGRACFEAVASKMHKSGLGEVVIHPKDEEMAKALLDAVRLSLSEQKYAPDLQSLFIERREKLLTLCKDFGSLKESLGYPRNEASPLWHKVQSDNLKALALLSYQGRVNYR